MHFIGREIFGKINLNKFPWPAANDKYAKKKG